MNLRRSGWGVAGVVTALVCVMWLVGGGPGVARAQHGEHQQPPAQSNQPAMQHMHAPVPPEYRDVQVPAGLWTNQTVIDRGRSIYAAKCAVCHGADGSGNGPGAVSLEPKPP